MNKIQRNNISQVINKLELISSEIENIKEIEEESRDNLNDYPQFENKVIDIEIVIDSLNDAISYIDDSIDSLKEAQQ